MNIRKNINKILTVTLILLVSATLYLIYAYYPLIRYKMNGEDLSKQILSHEISLSKENTTEQKTLKEIPKENTLLIPKIGVNSRIIEGESLDILDSKEGVWREPQTSNPERGSNMVIAGHRRQFLPPNTSTFYLLPQLKKGDYIIVYWNQKEYLYEVTESFESQVYNDKVYEKTLNTSLTLYTCTPLETSAHRWVIKAKQII